MANWRKWSLDSLRLRRNSGRRKDATVARAEMYEQDSLSCPHALRAMSGDHPPSA